MEYLLRDVPKPLWDEVAEYLEEYNNGAFRATHGLPAMSIKSFIYKAMREKLAGDHKGVKIKREGVAK